MIEVRGTSDGMELELELNRKRRYLGGHMAFPMNLRGRIGIMDWLFVVKGLCAAGVGVGEGTE